MLDYISALHTPIWFFSNIVTYQHVSLADSTEKGWVDVDLSEKGLGEAKGAGELLKAAPW